MKSVGIDIGSQSLKVAEVVANGASYILQDFLELPLPSEPGLDNRVEIVSQLRQIASHYGDDSVRYVIAVPQERLAMRTLSFPVRERHKILKSLAFELEEDIPFDQDDAVFDAKIVRTLGNSAEALCFACPKSYIEELLKIAQEAGIDPDLISVDAPAISNLFEAWLLPPREISGPKAVQERAEISQSIENTGDSTESVSGAQIVINIGHRRTLLAVFYRGTLVATRTVSRGGHDLVEALRRAYSLPYLEAQKGLQEKGFVLTSHDGATQDQVEFSNVIVQALKPIADDIKFTLLEMKSQYGLSFSQGLISGGVARLMNISAFMTKELEIPCNVFRYLERVPKSNAVASSALEFSALPAIGLAIEGLKRPRNPAINLRRQEFGKQSRSVKVFYEKWGHALKLAGVALAIFYVYSFTRDIFSDRLEVAAKDVLASTAKDSFGLKGRAATESKIKSFIKDKKMEIEAKKQIADLQSLNSALDIVALLSEKMPNKKQLTVDIHRFLLKNESLTIEGEVPSKAQMDLVRSTLQNFALDRQVRELGASLPPSPGKMVFAYTFKVNRK